MSVFTPEAASRLPGPEWLRSRRTAAAERFGALELPTEAEEVWRYSRISELDLDAYAPVEGGGPSGLPTEAEGGVLAVGETAGLLVVRDGHVVHAELDPAVEAAGVVLGDVLDADDGDDAVGSVAASDTD